MVSPQHTCSNGSRFFLFFVFIITGSACAEKVGGENDISDWQSYSNVESGFTFQYPTDWEVVDDGFYKTAYVVTIQKIGGSEDSNNWIRINSPQFMEENGQCLEADGQQICTYSTDANVLNIYHRVAAGFKLEHAQKDKEQTGMPKAEGN